MFKPFRVKHLVATPGVFELFKRRDTAERAIKYLVARHMAGDWGDVCDDDARSNDNAIRTGDRTLGVYLIEGARVWVICDAWEEDDCGRVVTVLLPSEY